MFPAAGQSANYPESKFHCEARPQVFSRRSGVSVPRFAGDCREMRNRKVVPARNGMRYAAATVGVAWACFIGVSSANAQAAASRQETHSTSRLLTVAEGRSIVDAAWEEDQPARGTQDCSHLVHQTYLNAGYEYPYASSFDIYAGSENFERVRTPQAGDLIVWPGHVGIVVDPLQHSFYSLVSTGWEAQDYEGAYWRSRGRPRFYRYKVGSSGNLTDAKVSASTQAPRSPGRETTPLAIDERSAAEYPAAKRAPKPASERTGAFYGPMPSATLEHPAKTAELPPSILIATGNKSPTREGVAAGISELSNAAGNVLRAGQPSALEMPVVIFERLQVERLELKRGHGWARVQIDSKVSIAGGSMDFKRRGEKIRWELRRTESGWEAVRPTDRIYLPRDAAVRNLAAQLARLAESEGAAAHQETVLQQESQLARLLSALLN